MKARGAELGYAMHVREKGKAGFVTAHLAVDYAGSALAFANGYLVDGAGRRIVRASAIFARAAEGAKPDR